MRVGAYLREARERRHLTIDEIAEAIKIKGELLVDLENNDLSRWPRHRVYRHGYLRSYTEAVGLDAKTMLKEFDAEFGDPYPAPFHGRPKVTKAPATFAIMPSAALVSALAVLIGTALTLLDAPNSAAGHPSAAAEVKASASQIDTRVFDSSPRPGPAESDIAPTAGREEVTETPLLDSEIEGELRIVSKPERAHVTVNGIARGETPVRVRYLPLGSYTIRVIQPGYKIGQTVVTLGPDQPNRTIRVVLRDSPMYARAPIESASSLQQ